MVMAPDITTTQIISGYGNQINQLLYVHYLNRIYNNYKSDIIGCIRSHHRYIAEILHIYTIVGFFFYKDVIRMVE